METPTDARSVAHFKRLRRSLVRACALNLIAQIALGTPLRFSGIRSQRRQTIAEKSSLTGCPEHATLNVLSVQRRKRQAVSDATQIIIGREHHDNDKGFS